MELGRYQIESKTPFSQSLIWKLNREFYHDRGISAWSDDIVPHHMTSNSMVGKTYAELIFGVLQDLQSKNQHKEVVYILELGSGHGRLAFHVLKHLDLLIASHDIELPPYCYILSDIVDENLSFFLTHPQLQSYFREGKLDVAYYHATNSKEIELKFANKTIQPKELGQPILAIGNYFFDSIPNELFYIQNKEIVSVELSIHSSEDPQKKNAEDLLKNLEFEYHSADVKFPFFKERLLDELLIDYRDTIPQTYLFFPKNSIHCLQNVKTFSKAGLILLTMDKGVHTLQNLNNRKEPEIIVHGSFSIWVNYHALSSYCTKQGGKVLFPSASNFHLEIACLFFLEDGASYRYTDAAYQQFVNNFGPDDFNSIKQLAYSNMSILKVREMIALFRLSAYDSTFFIKLLPRFKQVLKSITYEERDRISETLDNIWDMYFDIKESFDLAYEIGGMFYDLGYYSKALDYFQNSVNAFGEKADIFYNQALCYYQLNQDASFYETLKDLKKQFPSFQLIQNLEALDMG